MTIRSSITRIVPYTARPTLSVSPMTFPARLRMADTRWRVRSTPARLSSPKLPMRSIVLLNVVLGDLG